MPRLRGSLVLSIAIILVDQAVKYYIATKEATVTFRAVHFGLFPNPSGAFSVVWPGSSLPIVSVVIVLVLIVWLYRLDPSEMAWGLAVAALVGGGVSNTLDRIRLGNVIDVVQIGTLSFNLADLAIIGGIVTLAYLGLSTQLLRKATELPSSE